MASADFLALLSAALGGGLTVKVLDIVYVEWRRRFDQTRTATEFVDAHLDPLLKAADELVGKLHSLGREDFASLRSLKDDINIADNTDLGGLLFLFARFWSRIEIIRLEGIGIAIAKDERGKRLQDFFDCLESTRVRLIDRTAQRAIAETILDSIKPPIHTIRYIDFAHLATTDGNVKHWLAPLRDLLIRGWNTTRKQKLLQYAIVLHAMIDTLDPQHVVTRNRPGLGNKLSGQTWRDLNYRVFGRYLRFVGSRRKYLGRSQREWPDVVVM